MSTPIPEQHKVRAMAGVVRATAYYSQASDGLEILPDTCPAADVHRKRAEKQNQADAAAWATARGLPSSPAMRPAPTYLKCSTINHRGERKWCRYYYGLADRHDETQRVDLSILSQAAIASGAGQVNCVVLCMGQQRNRPPGV